jgi:hypothetical protein
MLFSWNTRFVPCQSHNPNRPITDGVGRFCNKNVWEDWKRKQLHFPFPFVEKCTDERILFHYLPCPCHLTEVLHLILKSRFYDKMAKYFCWLMRLGWKNGLYYYALLSVSDTMFVSWSSAHALLRLCSSVYDTKCVQDCKMSSNNKELLPDWRQHLRKDHHSTKYNAQCTVKKAIISSYANSML